MIDPASIPNLKSTIFDCIETDQVVLDMLREEIRPLKHITRRIQPRAATSISLVGTDGGNTNLRFDPYLIQLIRVVDSSNNSYCLEVVSPTTPIQKLNDFQFNPDGSPRTALGEMMTFLGVSSLQELSDMISITPKGQPVSPSWVRIYRELIEWAVLFSSLKKDFGTDTLIIFDGLLRSKVFSGTLFHKLLQGMKERIDWHWNNSHRRVYLAGVAKHSKVLSRYRLAMTLEGILQTDYPAYLEVPREIEEKAYIWSEFARGDDRVIESGGINKFVGGKMFLVKFGSHRYDPVWPVDIFVPQMADAQTILGSMLSDAVNGFPIPYYPLCLQKAHENAALVKFDISIIQDYIYEGLLHSMTKDRDRLISFLLRDNNPSQKRYK